MTDTLYASLGDLHSYLNVDNTDTTNDTAMQMALDSAASAIDRATNRTFVAQDTVATTRYYTPVRQHGQEAFLMPSMQWSYWYPFSGDWSWFWTSPEQKVFVDDIFLTNQVITDITVKDHDTGNAIALDRLWPLNAIAKGKPATALLFLSSTVLPRGEGSIEVTAKFGWPSVPTTIKNATLLQAARYLKRKDSPLGGIAGSMATGDVIRAAAVDPDIEKMIGDYRRWWAAA